ncbi:MAG: RIP metalloprotease RseP [Chitinophagales bacterium]
MKAAQLILSLSILVLFHELGHFIAARAFKTRVEKFYLFFDFLFPFPGLLNFALFKKKIGDTEYGMGWFPLGGYVKIAGMVDESADPAELDHPPLPDEFRSKKNWQKLIIMLGGIIMNLILAWIIYSQLLFWAGEITLPAANAKYGVACDSLALEIGFHNGDVIMSHDGGKAFQSFQSIGKEILLDDVKKVEVLRDGQPLTITIPADFTARAVAAGNKGAAHPLFEFNIPCLVGGFSDSSVVKGVLQKGDIITAINGQPIRFFSEVRPILSTLKNKPAQLTVLRGNDSLNVSVTVPASGLLGFNVPADLKAYKGYIDFVERKYGFFESFGAGAVKAKEKLFDYLKQFKLIFNPKVKGYKQLGSVGTMASLFPAEWDWVAFWSLTALISLILAVANLLPIPMLDGGYVILLLFEMISGKKLEDKTVEKINQVGLVLLLALMIFAVVNDIRRFM